MRTADGRCGNDSRVLNCLVEKFYSASSKNMAGRL